MTKVLTTGATGFVGAHVAQRLDEEGFVVIAPIRNASSCGSLNVDMPVVGNLDGETNWGTVLRDVEIVVHCAARAHILKDELADPLEEYRRVNVEGTLNLARQAVNVGVKRFVYISSIKVNGEQTPKNSPFSADDACAPEDPYGISKMEAERGLQDLATETGLEVVIIRPPLVYGAGVKGNFARMVTLVGKGLPLPLGAVDNKRSLVAVDNLVDLIVTCTRHPRAVNQVFLAGDGEDLSTTELLNWLYKAMGKRPRLIPVPPGLLMIGATVLGKKSVAQRLLGSLQVDISKARELLGWEPPISVDEGLVRTVKKLGH